MAYGQLHAHALQQHLGAQQIASLHACVLEARMDHAVLEWQDDPDIVGTFCIDLVHAATDALIAFYRALCSIGIARSVPEMHTLANEGMEASSSPGVRSHLRLCSR